MSARPATTRTTPRTAGSTRPSVPAPRGRRGALPVPLGSLTQREHRQGHSCPACGSERVTRLSMQLTDGTPADFTSCHACSHRVWHSEGAELPVSAVLDRTRKVR